MTGSEQPSQENKYFTPETEDIRVGYECEINKGMLPGISEGWHKYTIVSFEGFEMMGKYGQIYRVPYLSQEQIEAEGWVKGKKGRFELQQVTIINDGDRTDWLVITETIKDKQQIAFKGECKDINTFRYICKLLKIN